MNKQKVIRFMGVYTVIAVLSLPAVSQDNFPPSTNPPGGLQSEQVPMLVTIGFDDNAMEDAMFWINDFLRDKRNPSNNGNPQTFDNLPCRVTFFNVGAAWLDTAWGISFNDGHEIANHTLFHNGQYPKFDGSPSGTLNSDSDWENDISVLNDSLTNWINKYNIDMGINNVFKKEYVKGFRTPRLEFTDATFQGMVAAGMLYDCSIEHTSNGSNTVWPYTLDNGPHSSAQKTCGRYPGLWEFPVYTIGGQVGFDYNYMVQLGNSGASYCNWLKGDFTARYNGNRSPMMVNAHTDTFSEEKWPGQGVERQKGLENFIMYVLSQKDARIVTYYNIIEYIRNPVKLGTPTWTAEDEMVLGDISAPKLAITSISRNSIHLEIPESGFYSIGVYTPNGKLINTIKKGYFHTGASSITWNNASLALGIYLIKIQGLQENAVKKFSFVD